MDIVWVVVIVAVIHLVFAGIEWFAWDWASGRLMGFDSPMADATKPLGGNFAIYNLLVGAGLLATHWLGDAQTDVQMWVLGSVVVAGVYGGATLKGVMLYALQAAPAALALIMLAAS